MTAADEQGIDTEALERSQEAIDEGNEAAVDALSDAEPDPDLDIPATGDGLDAEESDVTPRPN